MRLDGLRVSIRRYDLPCWCGGRREAEKAYYNGVIHLQMRSGLECNTSGVVKKGGAVVGGGNEGGAHACGPRSQFTHRKCGTVAQASHSDHQTGAHHTRAECSFQQRHTTQTFKIIAGLIRHSTFPLHRRLKAAASDGPPGDIPERDGPPLARKLLGYPLNLELEDQRAAGGWSARALRRVSDKLGGRRQRD